jgi:hypothetical protein
MYIQLDKIELCNRIGGLQLKTNYLRENCSDMYYDTEMNLFFVEVNHGPGNKYSGRILVPPHNVACAHVSPVSIPKHQPIGTPENRDTPSGHKRKNTMATAKTALAEKIEARKASSD